MLENIYRCGQLCDKFHNGYNVEIEGVKKFWKLKAPLGGRVYDRHTSERLRNCLYCLQGDSYDI